MATVPNYYYNSPWIAEAGRNLASALAPPDPLRTLEAQKQKMSMDLLQRQQQIMEEDRATHQAGVRSLGNIFTNPEPVTAGSPGEMAYLKTQYPGGLPAGPSDEDIKNVLASDIPLGNFLTLLGTKDPRYLQKLGLNESKRDQAFDLLTTKLLYDASKTDKLEGGRNDRFTASEDRIRDLATELDTTKRYIAELQARTSRENSQDRLGASGNMRPINIPVTALPELRREHQKYLRDRGITNPDPRLLDSLSQLSLRYYKEGYNDSVPLAQEYFFGKNPQIQPFVDNWGPNNTPESITFNNGMSLDSLIQGMPDFGQGERTYGDAIPPQSGATGAPMAPPSGMAAPPSGLVAPPTPASAPTQNVMTPERAQLLTKEGEVVMFGDGTAGVLIGGQPVFIPADRLQEIIRRQAGGG